MEKGILASQRKRVRRRVLGPVSWVKELKKLSKRASKTLQAISS
jgi:hypothetical protein